MTISLEELAAALKRSWSIKTSSKWLKANPARGQCSVTALTVQELLGGEIMKTNAEGYWHFYNVIDGKRLDFSESQFDTILDYQDFPSSRTEALTDTTSEQYAELLMRTRRALADAKNRLEASDEL